MSRKHQENLKEQLISAMENRFGRLLAESVFQCDLWPVLDKAIEAGELLVARNTRPVLPVPVALRTWLVALIETMKVVHKFEKSLTKEDLLRNLYSLESSASKALADAEQDDSRIRKIS